MKYKKQIVMICLITFLFLPFQKYEEPKAEILTLTTGVIISCAALATVAGLVITNPDMLQDVGTIVYEGIKDIDGAIEKVGDKVKINVTKTLLEKLVPYLVENVPTDTVYRDENVSETLSSDSSFVYKVSIPNVGSSVTYNMNYTGVGIPRFRVSTVHKDYPNSAWYDICAKPIDDSSLSTFNIELKIERADTSYFNYTYYLNGAEYYTGSKSIKYMSDMINLRLERSVSSLNGVVDGTLTFDKTDSICIPYTEKNTESVSADKPKEYFPVGSGSISVPIDTPLSNYNPSVDNPISLPSDLVGDGISADVDTSTDTGAIDKPNVDVGETPTTGDSLWDTLLSWLSALFSPLFSLLSWIGDLLNSILDFLKSLVIPEEFNSLDFSPLYFSFANKFPFCIPFDLINMIKEFESEKKEPKFYVDMSAFSNNIAKTGNVGFEIDLTKFDELITIVRTITLISFIFYIAFKTRDIIKG